MRHWASLFTFCLFCHFVHGQNNKTGIVIKAGFSHATQQWGLSPVDHIRPPHRGIQSGFVFVGYDFLRKRKADLILGAQYVEKGFRVKYVNDVPGILKQDAGYQYLLQYVEMPIYYRYKHNRFYYSGGVIFSYLLNDVYSYREKITATNNVTGTTSTYDINYELAYNDLYDRISTYDWGIGAGIAYELKPGIEVELNAQKHFIQVDKWKQRDLVYNLAFLLGLKVSL